MAGAVVIGGALVGVRLGSLTLSGLALDQALGWPHPLHGRIKRLRRRGVVLG